MLEKVMFPSKKMVSVTLPATSKCMNQRPLPYIYQNQKVSQQDLRHLCLMGSFSSHLWLCFCILPAWCQTVSSSHWMVTQKLAVTLHSAVKSSKETPELLVFLGAETELRSAGGVLWCGRGCYHPWWWRT